MGEGGSSLRSSGTAVRGCGFVRALGHDGAGVLTQVTLESVSSGEAKTRARRGRGYLQRERLLCKEWKRQRVQIRGNP